MRKRISAEHRDNAIETDRGWMNLEDLATVEVTSEMPDFRIESAFNQNGGAGWRAREAGKQLIRLIFDSPLPLQHIQLRFDEPSCERTQEFTLRWSSAQGGAPQEVVRQQWNFSPTGSRVEIEEYAVNLASVSALELEIGPDVSGGNAIATLTSWRVR
jgi:uncharacterized protein (DUF736 family)